MLVAVAFGVALGYCLREWPIATPARSAAGDSKNDERRRPDYRLAPESPAAYDPDWRRTYPQSQPVGETLLQPPNLRPGEATPQDLWKYGGKGKSSQASVDDIEDFAAFYKMCSDHKAKVNADRSAYMNTRYNFTGKVDSGATMTKGKPLPVGPVVRLPAGFSCWEELAELDAASIRARDLFPAGFRPLSHPLQSVGHMLFPQSWTAAHPEHERFDVDFDIPNAYLPEFPPPLFLTTRPDLGDVSQGYEINQANFRELFEGILTPEQMEGLRLLVTRFPTTWFNQTKHRATKLPVRGVACLDCHVNGHTNGTIAMDPGVRPTLLRERTDTPTLRGNHNFRLFSSRRSIRTLDHFAEVEEYFDGDITLQPQIGGRQLDKVSTNRMGDFNSIIAWPPAPKLDVFGKLIAAKASASELRGEALFSGKARCASCHPAPTFTDQEMHDLQVEAFYPGRAEGWVKTFSLRGIKDSPPYLHDGRLPTLEDSVEFFNLVLGVKLGKDEKRDLVAYLRCL